jgi:hypothetical protein
MVKITGKAGDDYDRPSENNDRPDRLGEDYERPELDSEEPFICADDVNENEHEHLITDPEVIAKIFDKWLLPWPLVTQNLSLRVSPSSGVQISKLLGYEPTIYGDGSILIPMCDLYAADKKIQLMEMVVPPLAEGVHKLADIICTGTDASTQEAAEIALQVEAHCTSDQYMTSQVNVKAERRAEFMRALEEHNADARLSDDSENELTSQLMPKWLEDILNDPTYFSDEFVYRLYFLGRGTKIGYRPHAEI